MDFKSLYMTTDGRISRKTWWIGALVLGVVNLVVSLLILPLVGLGGPNVAAIMAAQNDPAAISAMMAGSMQASAWGSLILLIIFAYPAYCLSLKRRHDKNNNGLDFVIYLALTAVVVLVQALGLGFSVTDVQGIPMPMPSMLFSVLGLVVGVYGIYLLIVLGFLRGTAGPNQYGADPLGGLAPAV